MSPEGNIDLTRLDALAERRREALVNADIAHADLLDAVVDSIIAGKGLVRLTDLAKRAGINRQTCYAELARRGIKP